MTLGTPKSCCKKLKLVCTSVCFDQVFLTVKPLVADLGKCDDPPGETVYGTGDETEVIG